MTSFIEDTVDSDLIDGEIRKTLIIASIRALKQAIRNIVGKNFRN